MVKRGTGIGWPATSIKEAAVSTGSMTPQDVLWLNMDRPTNLMVVDSLVTFTTAADWEKVTGTLQERLVGRFPVFSRVPAMPSTPTGTPHWVDFPGFDIEAHIVRHTLPEPGGRAELQAYVSGQRSVPLDRDKPLWVVHYIDNFEGRSAIFTRLHHAIADGIRLTMVVLSLCDNAEGGQLGAPTEVGKPKGNGGGKGLPGKAMGAVGAVGAAVGAAKDKALGLATSPKETVVETVAGAGQRARAVGDLAGSMAGSVAEGVLSSTMSSELLDADRFEDYSLTVERNAKILPKLLLADSDPGPWTGELGVDKVLTWSDALPLEEIKSIGRSTGTTVNDVVISVLSSALRRYAAERDQVVGKVAWFVPVNVRPLDQNLPPDLGNSFALIVLQMPLDIEDPVVTLAEMKARMDDIKNSLEGQLTFGIQSAIARAPERIYTFGVEFFANRGVGVLSNVPGPQEPVFLAGHKADMIVGFAPCNGEQPMTVTIFSYNGSVRVGFAGDEGLMPDIDELPRLYRESLDALRREVLDIEEASIQLPASVL